MNERLVASLVGSLGGWVLGWITAWATDWLQQQDGLPSTGHGPLIRDLWVQAASAVLGAATPWLTPAPWWRWAITLALGVPLMQVAVTDLRHRYVYTLIALVGLLLGVALSWQLQQVPAWTGAAGALGGGLAFGLIYLLGRLLYRGGEPMARGDITIAAMVGATAGACTARALVLGVLLSGLFALAVLIARRSRHVYLPYGPGLCLGGLITLFWC